MDEIYRSLARHIDALSAGFPAAQDGADLRLLRRLFTPEEAALAVHLGLELEDPGTVAQRAGRPPQEVADRLAAMAGKGLVFAVSPETGPTRYQAAPFVVGIYEFQVGRLTPELLHDVNAYWQAPKERTARPGPPQMRTIPVHQRIDLPTEALPYEQVDRLLENHSRFAVAPCICRRHARLNGGGCDAPGESCLVFDEWADFYVRHIEGRYIDLDEVRAIIARAEQHGLVLQPSNSQRAAFVCCCCSCCCGILAGLKRFRQPARIVASAFVATLDVAACNGCEACLARCPMDALSLQDGQVALEAQRCIGCGLCTSTCPSGALRLERKPPERQAEVPPDMFATWRRTARTAPGAR